jgi:hypothetical protein
MRLMKIGYTVALAAALVIPVTGQATDGTGTPVGGSVPATRPSPAQPRLADAPEQIGRSFSQVGDSVKHGAKTIGRVVETGARRVGRSFDEGWRGFKRGMSGD